MALENQQGVTGAATDADVITVKGTFLRAKKATNYLLSKWWLILLAALVGGTIGFFIASSAKPTYTGSLNFVLSTGSKSNNISGLASQFGFDLGQTSNGDVFSGDNIISLFRSKKMIKSVLFERPPGSGDILANIIVRELQWDKAWKNNERTKGAFPFPADVTKLTPTQDSLVREVYFNILKKQLTISRTDPKLSLYTLSTTSTNELVACYLTRFLMDETADFYIKTKTSSSKEALQLLQKEADSLRGLLSGSIVTTAAEADRTFALNPAMQVQRAPAQRGQIKTTVLTTAYAEVVRNLELAKITLQKENPLYEIIDYPELPLVRDKASRKSSFLIGLMLAGFAMVFYLIVARLFKSLNT